MYAITTSEAPSRSAVRAASIAALPRPRPRRSQLLRHAFSSVRGSRARRAAAVSLILIELEVERRRRQSRGTRRRAGERIEREPRPQTHAEPQLT
jgi:hypothetical protein